MKAAVIVFPGSNCDRDMAVALKAASGRNPCMVWHGEHSLPKVDMIAVPGGFSYGDYLRAGAMAARSPIMRAVVRAANEGVIVLGVCNGFQILTEAGLLPGALMRNAGLSFVCRDIYLRTETTACPFTSGASSGAIIRIPVAHHEGNYFADRETLHRLTAEDRIAYRYCDAAGDLSEKANPNGSVDGIAGILNERRNVLGMMPHPERLADTALGGADGRSLFDSLIGNLT